MKTTSFLLAFATLAFVALSGAGALIPIASASDDHIYSSSSDCGLLAGYCAVSWSACVTWPHPIACFDRGHVPQGATIALEDSIVGGIAGFVCNDSDEDGLCGESGEYDALFCGEHVLGAAWDDSELTYVIVGGAGSSAEACSLVQGTAGTTGWVHHTDF